MNGRAQDIGLTYYLTVLRRRWKVIVASTLIGTAAGFGATFALDQSYTATTAVNLNVITTDPFSVARSASGLLDGRTEAQIAMSHAVISEAVRQLDADRTVTEVREAMEVVPVGDATVIEVSYTTSSAEAAKDGADALAAAYLSFREDRAEDRLSNMMTRIGERLAILREGLAEANTRVAAAEPESGDAHQAASDRESITMELNSLITERSRLESIDTEGGSVLTPARENQVEVSPSRRLLTASGLMGGFLAGIVLAFVAQALGRRLLSTGDIERAAQADVLAELTGTTGTIPLTETDMEAVRIAREHLLAELRQTPMVVTVITHATEAGVAVEVSTNLALALSQEIAGVDLVLPAMDDGIEAAVCAALELRTVDDRPGARFYHSAVGTGLSVLATDRVASMTEADPVVTAAVRNHLRQASRPDVTLLGLPADAAPASRLLAQRLSDAAVLVVARRSGRADQLAATARELRRAGVPVLGVLSVPHGRTWTPKPTRPTRHQVLAAQQSGSSGNV